MLADGGGGSVVLAEVVGDAVDELVGAGVGVGLGLLLVVLEQLISNKSRANTRTTSGHFQCLITITSLT